MYCVLPITVIIWYQYYEYDYFTPFNMYVGAFIIIVFTFDDLFIWWNAAQEARMAIGEDNSV